MDADDQDALRRFLEEVREIVQQSIAKTHEQNLQEDTGLRDDGGYVLTHADGSQTAGGLKNGLDQVIAPVGILTGEAHGHHTLSVAGDVVTGIDPGLIERVVHALTSAEFIAQSTASALVGLATTAEGRHTLHGIMELAELVVRYLSQY